MSQTVLAPCSHLAYKNFPIATSSIHLLEYLNGVSILYQYHTSTPLSGSL